MAASVLRPARTLKERVAAYERRLIKAALERAGGNQREAAVALGVLPTTLHEKLKRHGIGVARRVVEVGRPGESSTEREAPLSA